MADHGDAGSAVPAAGRPGGLDARAVLLEGVARRHASARAALGALDGRIVHGAQRVEQGLLRVVGVEGRHAERGLLEAPRLRQLRHGAQRQAAQVHRVLALGATLAGEADAHAAVRLHVGPVRAQTVVADDQVLGNVPYQVVVELPRRVVAVRAGEADNVVAGVVRAAVFLGASHGRTVPLSRAEPPDGASFGAVHGGPIHIFNRV